MAARRIAQLNSSPKVYSRADIPLFIAVILLTIFGLVMVYDSSVIHAYKDFGDSYHYIKQQLVWALLGFGALITFSLFPYQALKKFALPIFVLAVIMLLAVMIPGLGVSSGGAHRWLKIGAFTLQPSEIVKLAAIILFAYVFQKKTKLEPFLIVTFLITLVLALIQRDLGSAIVYFLVCLVMYLVAGAPMKHFYIMIPVVLVGFAGFVMTAPYRMYRILAFLDPFRDPTGYTYHIAQVLIALGSGGIFGLGLGQSRQKFEYIPEVSTDSIFAVVGEELGLLGAVVLFSLFIFILYRGFLIAAKTEDTFGKYLAFGLTSWIGIQAIINLGAMVSLVPLTGVPLPFVSYGGSALLTNLTAIGILLNISRRKGESTV